jgi:hypothetical protein
MIELDDLERRLEALIEYYLSIGCPCRFPRFRAVVSRDTSKVAGGSFTSADQQYLILAFERKAPIVEKRPLEIFTEVKEGLWLARCGKCGSDLRRAYDEFSPGGFIDGLIVRRAPGLVDLGAPVHHGRVYRSRPFVAPGPAMGGMAQAAKAFPHIDEDAWFVWMRALNDDTRPSSTGPA